MDKSNPFSLNIAGVQDLIGNLINKVQNGDNFSPEGASAERMDVLDISMSDIELLKLHDSYEKKYAPYEGRLKPRVKKIKDSYEGKRPDGSWIYDNEIPIAANLQFEATETFLAAALAKNPEPVVYADNTEEGNAIATAVKTMLQFHADQLVIRRKLALMVRQWSMNLLGVLQPGWNDRIKDVMIDNDKIQDYVFDPEGFVDAYGDFSSWYGKRKKVTAEKLIELFPEHRTYIAQTCDNKLGTEVVYTEWWPNDEYCFYTYKEKVLDKHKNQYFNYPEIVKDINGEPIVDPVTNEPKKTKPRNHFAHPKKPGIFLSVFSLQEQPHDITSLMEQNIPNQNRITRQTEQIDFNASASNNSYAFSEDNFNQETGRQAANARRKGNPILIPSGGPITNAILPLPAQQLPNDFFNNLEIAKNDLRMSWGVQGITSQPGEEDQTARGMILNQSHDTSRIGGGIGSAIEQVADNVFNWLVQLYYVFYDEQHFAAIMGNAKAVEYVTLSREKFDRQLIVSVAPDSMKPKDEVTNMNLAQALYDKGAIGPKTLLKMVNFPDVDQAAADGVMWKIDPMGYFQLNFPEYAQQLQAQQQQSMLGAQVPPQVGSPEVPPPAPEGLTEPAGDLTRAPSSSALSNVPLNSVPLPK